MSASQEPRIGVYICHCGINIAGVVDVEAVREYAEKLPNVVVAKTYLYTCSSPGQAMIETDISEQKLNRVVVASCSPRMHEATFRKVVEEGGLNPYLFEMANIREHCSWVHSAEPERATKKAEDLVRIAVAKARLLEPLQKKSVAVTERALVIGAGMAGMRSALDLAERGFEVCLVEEQPTIGGKTARLNTLYPTGESAIDVVAPLMKEVASHPNIKLFTNSEITNVDGYIGNFKVKITKRPRFVSERCNACARCESVCPVDVSNEFDFHLTKRKAIYMPFRSAVPQAYVIDEKTCNKCGKCLEVCEKKAIDLNEKPEELEFDIGTIVTAIGFDSYEPPEGEFGYKTHKNVITMLQLERILDKDGPTGGELVLGNAYGPFFRSTPAKNIVFISCVGARQEPGVYKPIREGQELNRYCSRVCCTGALKNALLIRKKYPDANVYYLYRDIRTFGRGHEKYYRDASEALIRFMKYDPHAPPIVTSNSDELTVTVDDVLTANETFAIKADLVVLATAMIPSAKLADIQGKLKITKSADGFLQEAHAKLRPLDTATEGIFIAGAAQGPKDVTDAVAMGSAAAAKASIPLAQGKVELEPIKSFVDVSKCDGCAMCVDPCTFKAIKIEEFNENGEVKKRAVVNEALCKGCGACAATCPPKAIYVRGFTLEQLTAQVNAALAES
jgi:heterodisulfide reductase subunit A